MARVADYSIIADGWVLETPGTKDTINFDVPSNIDPGSRSILGFMVHVWAVDDSYVLTAIGKSGPTIRSTASATEFGDLNLLMSFE